MTDPTSPSIHARELHSIDDETARDFVDSVFGRADEWLSPLIQYRLSSDFQGDWKAEVGHWLKTAERAGFLDKVLGRIVKRAKTPPMQVVCPARDPNDPHHRTLAQELAPAMVAHYLVGTGWAFDAGEPLTGEEIDIDLSLRAPDGTSVMLQVKAPDQPGYVVCHRLVDGEFDDRIVKALDKAVAQLPQSETNANIIVVSANRVWPLASDPHCVVSHVIGSTLQVDDVVTLPRSRFGKFWTPEWKHITGVVLLDYVRSVEEFTYGCTVLLNPVADVKASADWFPCGRVCVLEGAEFRWVRGAPGVAHTIPDGTVVVEGE